MDNDPQYRTDDGSALRIWRDVAKNNFLSEASGRPVFDEAIFVEVIAPGSAGSTPVFEVKRTFHPDANMQPLLGMQYEQFKKYIEAFEKDELDDASMVGTPLKEWPEISRTMAASLKASAIHSVEGLANLSDEKLTVVGPDGRTWREKAKAFLASAENSAVATEMAAKLEAANTLAASQAEQIKELSEKLDAVLRSQQTPPTPPPLLPPVEQQAAEKPAKAKTPAEAGNII